MTSAIWYLLSDPLSELEPLLSELEQAVRTRLPAIRVAAAALRRRGGADEMLDQREGRGRADVLAQVLPARGQHAGDLRPVRRHRVVGGDQVRGTVRQGDRVSGRRLVDAHPARPQAPSVRVVQPALAVLQVAATFGVEAGLVSADSALREGLVTREDLTETLAARPLGNGAPRARTMIQDVNRLSESAGETRCRWLFHVLGLPSPELQAVIRDRAGRFIGRVDFLFADERTIVEFDGLVKYTERQSLVAEKAREDALRALGFSVVRITWADLAHPQRVLGKVLRGFQSARPAA